MGILVKPTHIQPTRNRESLPGITYHFGRFIGLLSRGLRVVVENAARTGDRGMWRVTAMRRKAPAPAVDKGLKDCMMASCGNGVDGKLVALE